MSLFLLDSDTVRLLRDRHPLVEGRYLSALVTDRVVTSAITVYESLMGWHSYILNARTPADLEKGFAELNRTVRGFTGIELIDFNQAAIGRFGQLIKLKLNVGKDDLRIALEAGATVVTRNLRDFRRVPGLVCEDWAV